MYISTGLTTGRFAPTPSGRLHFGSLVTAVASYCNTKSLGGEWLVRMEDLDTPRVVPGVADDILTTLECFGFVWDKSVIYQSQRFEIYQAYLDKLIRQGVVYGCSCSRKQLLQKNHKKGPLGTIYGSFCRLKNLSLSNSRLRLNVQQAGTISFIDQHYGSVQRVLVEEIGDFTLRRQDGIYAYHLAVVIDDALQQVNSIVRGADLLDASCVHIHLNQLLGFTTAQYLHIPLAKNNSGEKLSKQTGAPPLSNQHPQKMLLKALHFLGQQTPQELETYQPVEILQYAVEHWNSHKIR